MFKTILGIISSTIIINSPLLPEFDLRKFIDDPSKSEVSNTDSFVNKISTPNSELRTPNSGLLALTTGNNQTLFNYSPRLLDAVTTLSRVRVQGATYYFTVHLPTNVGESLQQLTLQQTQGLERIAFYLDDTIAFEGRPVNRDNNVNIARVKRNLDNNTIAVIFDPPIPPGKTFTIALKPKSNPQMSGNYQFAITAYPAGENPQGLYLGLGRFNFNQKGDRFP